MNPGGSASCPNSPMERVLGPPQLAWQVSGPTRPWLRGVAPSLQSVPRWNRTPPQTQQSRHTSKHAPVSFFWRC